MSPGDSGAPGRQTRGDDAAEDITTIPHATDRLPYRRRRWTYSRVISKALTGTVPLYGSADWDRLPDNDVRRWAALAAAAECWARQADDLVRDLELELRLAAEADDRHENADYRARAAEHRETWRHLPNAPTPFAGQEVPPRPLDEIGRDYLRGEAS